jgi:hypothetical protein
MKKRETTCKTSTSMKNIKTDILKKGSEGPRAVLTLLRTGRIGGALVNTVTNLRIPRNAGNFFFN